MLARKQLELHQLGMTGNTALLPPLVRQISPD
jgi:hypothetical protein